MRRWALRAVALWCVWLLVTNWHAGNLTTGSFVILGLAATFNLGVWVFLIRGFELFERDQDEAYRQRLIREEDAKRAPKPRTKGSA